MDKEIEIINHMRTNGKRPNISRIARELNLPISTVAERIKKIEEKYIAKHTSLLDYNKLGYFANTFLAIKVDAEQKSEFLDFLKDQKCINSVYFVNSAYNFLVELVCRDHLETINWIENVSKKFSSEITQFQVLKTDEKERFMCDIGGGV